MKILHVSTPMSWRGGEQQAAHLAIALKQFNIEEAVVCPENSELQRRLEQSGIRVFPFTKTGALDIGLANKFARICKEEDISIVHAHDSHAHSAAVFSAAFFGNKTPVVVSRRVDFAISSSLLSGWKYNHTSIKKIICVSTAIKDITETRIRNKEKLCVVPDGIDLSRYQNLAKENILRTTYNIPDNVTIIGNLSAIADHKDYPTFIATAEKLLRKNKNLHFFIVGDGPDREQIEKLIVSKKLGDKITLTGFRKDVPAVLSSLDIFLMTSKTEGLGSIVLEAFACKIPVVATRAGGIPELVQDEKTGLLADIGDSDELALQVIRLQTDSSLKQTLIVNAANYVKDFSYTHTAQKTLDIYSEVLKSNHE